MKMWSGRFRAPLDPEFERWQRSLPFDRRLLKHELAASSAYARALNKAGALAECELDAILTGLEQIMEKAEASPGYLEDDDAEDIHHFVEKQLSSLIGEAGLKLHNGRSRNEQIATDLRLYVREAIDNLHIALLDLSENLLGRAEEAGDAVMPAYTHLQRAEPVMAAHWLLAYVEMFLRDAERLIDCRKRVNVCPLGSGAVAGSTLTLDRAAIAAELRFDGCTANSVDATCDRDFVLEYASVVSLLSLHMSRCAEEMILYSTTEFGFVHPQEVFSTGSSAMPQKKNPDFLELVRGKAGRIVGALTALQLTLKGLPLAYNKDLQEMQEPMFEASETAAVMVALAGEWLRLAEYDYPRMKSAVASGFMNAFAAATYLAEKGVPFRTAHEQVGKAVQFCIEKGCELHDLSLVELQGFSSAFASDVFSRLTIESVLEIHDVPGGTAPKHVKRALEVTKRRILAIRGVAHAHA